MLKIQFCLIKDHWIGVYLEQPTIIAIQPEKNRKLVETARIVSLVPLSAVQLLGRGKGMTTLV